MRQFDVFRTPAGGRGARLLVVVQSHLLIGLATVLAAPLLAQWEVRGRGGVFVAVALDGEPLTADLALLANLPVSRLTHRVGSLAAYEDEIRRGLDRLFTGF